MTPACPKCGSLEVRRHEEWLEADDERFKSTHQCMNPKCHHESFRYTEGEKERHEEVA